MENYLENGQRHLTMYWEGVMKLKMEKKYSCLQWAIFVLAKPNEENDQDRRKEEILRQKKVWGKRERTTLTQLFWQSILSAQICGLNAKNVWFDIQSAYFPTFKEKLLQDSLNDVKGFHNHFCFCFPQNVYHEFFHVSCKIHNFYESLNEPFGNWK